MCLRAFSFLLGFFWPVEVSNNPLFFSEICSKSHFISLVLIFRGNHYWSWFEYIYQSYCFQIFKVFFWSILFCHCCFCVTDFCPDPCFSCHPPCLNLVCSSLSGTLARVVNLFEIFVWLLFFRQVPIGGTFTLPNWIWDLCRLCACPGGQTAQLPRGLPLGSGHPAGSMRLSSFCLESSFCSSESFPVLLGFLMIFYFLLCWLPFSLTHREAPVAVTEPSSLAVALSGRMSSRLPCIFWGLVVFLEAGC